MVDVDDLPRRAAVRTARLAGLPLGFAGRATLGLGRRLGGRPAELVAAEVQARTAEQLFKVLGELKGGAMKFGQALSVFEAALPEDLAGPYRATLTRLQEAAPPLPARTRAPGAGPRARRRLARTGSRTSTTRRPPRPRSARCTARSGPTAARSPSRCSTRAPARPCSSDLNQIGRMSRLVGVLVPGLDVKPLVAELKARVTEELDYELEAQSQQAFADGVRRRPGHPGARTSSTAPSRSWSPSGSRAHRCRAIIAERQPGASATGPACCSPGSCSPARHVPVCCTPTRTRATSGCSTTAGSACSTSAPSTGCPDGLPAPIGPLLRLAVEGDAQGVLDGLRAEGFVRPGVDLDAERLLAYLAPILDPAREETFRFSRAWLRSQAVRVGDPRSPAYSTGLQLNLPPEYLLIHRVTAGTIGVLCQLEAEAAVAGRAQHLAARLRPTRSPQAHAAQEHPP